MSPGVTVILCVVAFVIYFLPCIIGGIRDKVHGGFAIFLLNLFFGWTLIGWLLAFVWASSGKTRRDQRVEDQRHRELMSALRGSEPAIGVRPDQLRVPSLGRRK